MGLQSVVEADCQKAFRGGDKTALAVLRLLKTALQNAEIEKRGKTGDREAKLTEAEALAVLKRQVKQLEEAGELFAQGGRPDLQAKNNAELAVLKRYLPAQISEEAVREVVNKVIAGLAGKAGLQFGKIMGVVMKELPGEADGTMVSRVVKELLAV